MGHASMSLYDQDGVVIRSNYQKVHAPHGLAVSATRCIGAGIQNRRGQEWQVR